MSSLILSPSCLSFYPVQSVVSFEGTQEFTSEHPRLQDFGGSLKPDGLALQHAASRWRCSLIMEVSTHTAATGSLGNSYKLQAKPPGLGRVLMGNVPAGLES